MVCWSLRRWRVCRPRSSTRWGITWRTTRTRRRSSITSVASWTSCRCCAPSPSRRYRESSISGLRVSCQSHRSSKSCSPRAFHSEGNFASFNRSSVRYRDYGVGYLQDLGPDSNKMADQGESSLLGNLKPVNKLIWFCKTRENWQIPKCYEAIHILFKWSYRLNIKYIKYVCFHVLLNCYKPHKPLF